MVNDTLVNGPEMSANRWLAKRLLDEKKKACCLFPTELI